MVRCLKELSFIIFPPIDRQIADINNLVIQFDIIYKCKNFGFVNVL